VCELLRDLGARSFRMTEIEQTVQKFARTDPDALALSGGYLFAPRPLHLVPGDRNAAR
jgi:hypothetical protein